MPGSARDKFIKSYGGLILAAFASALFTIVVVVPAALEHRDISNEAAYRSAHYTKNAYGYISPECVEPSAQARQYCADEKYRSDRENERAEYDVASQKIMAVWTAVMGSVAVIGVGLSAVGVFLIWTTFKATQRAADSSTKTYEAYVAVERARLHIGVTTIWKEGDSLRCKIVAHNYGRTDCIVYALAHDWRHKSSDVTDDGITVAEQKNILIKPGTQEFLGASRGGNIEREFLYIYVKYKSALSTDHRAYAAFEVWADGEHGEDAFGAPTGTYLQRQIRLKGMPEDT